MPKVALLGADGLVGALVGEELRLRGLEPTALDTRNGSAVPVALPGDASLVIDAAGLTGADARALLEAACRRGMDLVDVSPSQAHVHAVHRSHPDVVDSGNRVVTGAGFQHLIGDALANLAGWATPGAREVHVAYTLPDRGALLAAASGGRRRSAGEALLVPALARVGGALVEDPIGEQRRLAWFPRPVGPAHAAAIPGGEAITVPRHLADVQTVRTYVALSGWRSELLQFTGNVARLPRVRDRLARRVTRPRGMLGPTARASIRWGCVAEAAGDSGVARAWAYGRDPYRLTAVIAVAVAESLLSGGHQPGVLAPAEICPPADMLDLVAERTDLRWSIVRPGA